jgi:hypothetical protein
LLPEPGKDVDVVGRCKHCGKKKKGFLNAHQWQPSWGTQARKAGRKSQAASRKKSIKPGFGISGNKGLTRPRINPGDVASR